MQVEDAKSAGLGIEVWKQCRSCIEQVLTYSWGPGAEAKWTVVE